MSYQVLARKYRPENFDQVVGQQHILSTLIYGLDHQRLHHAYLFTGTRGVGKTSLARLFAKCINCQQGITAKPCNTCSSCQAIDKGNFVDLIEVDGASRTKVEDIRELLDNVQYMPTQGRYKVYLIDEVHMLSTHSFNALLKTLEEPPEHTKFLLATTDPQKIPATIVSRCLQFYLRPLSEKQIIQHLQTILRQEDIDFTIGSITALAKAAQGSLRDALSLLDQAINHSSGQLTTEGVGQMLGVADDQMLRQMIQYIHQGESQSIQALAQSAIEKGRSPNNILDQLAEIWCDISMAHLTSGEPFSLFGDDEIQQWRQLFPSEIAHLFYQLTIKAKEDIALAPTPIIGLTMALFRLIAFRPDPQQDNITQVPINNICDRDHKQSLETLQETPKTNDDLTTYWQQTAPKLALSGSTKQVALHSHLQKIEQNCYYLLPDKTVEPLININTAEKIAKALTQITKNDQQVKFQDSMTNHHDDDKKKITPSPSNNTLTPAEKQKKQEFQRKEHIYHQLVNNKQIKQLINTFSLSFNPDNIKLKKHDVNE